MKKIIIILILNIYSFHIEAKTYYCPPPPLSVYLGERIWNGEVGRQGKSISKAKKIYEYFLGERYLISKWMSYGTSNTTLNNSFIECCSTIKKNNKSNIICIKRKVKKSICKNESLLVTENNHKEVKKIKFLCS